MLAETEEREHERPHKLATEGPLAEKDQQGLATEHQRKLGEKALEKWKSLKAKIKGKFKK